MARKGKTTIGNPEECCFVATPSLSNNSL